MSGLETLVKKDWKRVAMWLSEQPGGFSVQLKANQIDASISILQPMKKGYMISIGMEPRKILSERISEQNLMNALKAFSPYMGGDTYLGGWFHDNTWHVEPSLHFVGTVEAAKELGRRLNQYSIYDLKTGKEIIL